MALALRPTFFDNYTKMASRVPALVWQIVRFSVLLLTLALAGLLIVKPVLGLKVLWRVAIPLVPLLLVIAPGLWRQVCPMAFLNQLPRMIGATRNHDLPDGLRNWAFAVAVGVFVGVVALRAPLLNHSGLAAAIMLFGAFGLALAGGFVFKGRSGWCGTFCPLGPIQRTYGQAPLIVVRNGFCQTCVGCQKNCYDFNPRAAVFSDVYDDDWRYSSQRRLFTGLLPGLVIGYFFQAADPEYGQVLRALILIGACCASAGLYGLAVSFSPVNPYRITVLFGCVALAVFYWFTGPELIEALGDLVSFSPPTWLVASSRHTGLAAAFVLLGSGLYSEAQYRASLRASEQAKVDQAQIALKDRLATSAGLTGVTDRATGIAFEVAPGANLLDAIQASGLKINYGCRLGLCGADAVAICEGHENLEPANETELATLRRLGLEGRARLACVCQVKGPVVIDRDPRSAHATTVPVPAAAVETVDRAKAAGIDRVVIIGNGVAGMTAAERLRANSESLDITMVTYEPGHFYNRMAIGRLIYDGTGMDGLKLVPDDWFIDNRVTVLRNTIVSAIDRSSKRVALATGVTLPYDKLILATGARASIPTPDFLSYKNAFVLRTAEDAHAIRYYVQHQRARRAVVIGGGVLGVEAADSLHRFGLQVTILHRSDRLMNGQLDQEGGDRLATYLESVGIQVVPSVGIDGFDGADAITAVWLSHGPRVRADVVIACIGIQPNTHLAAAAGLDVRRGISVDMSMRTSDPDIYAIGDAADMEGPSGLWPVGAAQAGTAVTSILGNTLFSPVPRSVLRLKCDGIDVYSYGSAMSITDGEEICAPDDAPAWWRLHLHDGKLSGGLYVGPPGSGGAFAKLLQTATDLGAKEDELRSGRFEEAARR